MLVLSRNKNESIMIGDDIEITIFDVQGDKVRLGIEAPREITVHRKEVWIKIQKEKDENKNHKDKKPFCSTITRQPIGESDISDKEIYSNDIVLHKNNIRPEGVFKVAWDEFKVGWVLLGVGKDKDFWLRDWSPKCVKIISDPSKVLEEKDAQN